jgi:hypothetical protein
MKNVFSTLLIFIAAIAFFVCGEVNALEVDDVHALNQVDFELSGEFEVTKTDRCSHNVDPEYSMVCQNDDYSFICIVDAETYATTDPYDRVSGHLFSKHDEQDGKISHFITTENKVFYVEWYGEIK